MRDKYAIPEVDAHTPLGVAAPAIVLAKAEPLFDLEGAASGGANSDAVHDMRVASRRLREAMRLLAPLYLEHGFRDWYRRVRRVTRVLGPVRDSDVFIEEFGRLARDVGDGGRRCVAFMVGHRLGLREHQLEVLNREFARVDLSKGKAAFEKSVRTIHEGGVAEAPLAEFARDAIAERADAVFETQPLAVDDRHVLEQHALRIDYKHLRYAVEVFAPCYAEEFEPLHYMLTAFQDTLGEMHDLYVFSRMLEQPDLAATAGRAGVSAEDIAQVAAVLDDRAHERFGGFLRLIAEYPPDDLRRALIVPLERGLAT